MHLPTIPFLLARHLCAAKEQAGCRTELPSALLLQDDGSTASGQGSTMEMSSALQTRFTAAAAGATACDGGGGGPGPSPAACAPDRPCPAVPAHVGQAVSC